jgi:hypothetical protein
MPGQRSEIPTATASSCGSGFSTRGKREVVQCRVKIQGYGASAPRRDEVLCRQRSALLLAKEALSDGVIERQFWSTDIVVGHPGRILGDHWERLRTAGLGIWPERQQHFRQPVGPENPLQPSTGR